MPHGLLILLLLATAESLHLEDETRSVLAAVKLGNGPKVGIKKGNDLCGVKRS